MIDQADAFRIVQRFRGNAVVIPVFRAGGPWHGVSNQCDILARRLREAV